MIGHTMYHGCDANADEYSHLCRPPRRAPTFAVIVTAVLFLMTSASVAQENGNSSAVAAKSSHDADLFSEPKAEGDDISLLDRLNAELQRLFERGTTAEAHRQFAQFLIDGHLQAKSRDIQTQLLLGFGYHSLEAGDVDVAEAVLNDIFENRPHHDLALIAAKHLLRHYRNQQRYRDAADIAKRVLAMTTLTTAQRIYFAGQAAPHLVATNDEAAAFHLLRSLLIEHPDRCDALAQSHENAAAAALTSLDSSELYYRELKWLQENAPCYVNTSRFLGNLAHAAHMQGQLQESLDIRKRILKDFPEDPRIVEHMFEAASLLQTFADYCAAKDIYEQILQMTSGSDNLNQLQEMTRGRLAIIAERGWCVKPVTLLPNNRTFRLIIIVLNVVLLSFVAWLALRSRRPVGASPQ